MERAAVYQAIDNERDYQDAKWGTPAEHPHEVGAYLTLMQVHLQRAQAAWTNCNGDADALDALRKVLAIGVSCGEQHGIPRREIP